MHVVELYVELHDNSPTPKVYTQPLPSTAPLIGATSLNQWASNFNQNIDKATSSLGEVPEKEEISNANVDDFNNTESDEVVDDDVNENLVHEFADFPNPAQIFNDGSRYGHLMTNMAKTINFILKGVRHLLVFIVFSTTFYILVAFMPNMRVKQETQMVTGLIYCEGVRTVH
ncbi:hypothetical protein GOBAR_DD35720 [Gossypium barbadense]|nr:hypothetical protein GOBAR_DD35720 [Gossypium barbadense]